MKSTKALRFALSAICVSVAAVCGCRGTKEPSQARDSGAIVFKIREVSGDAVGGSPVRSWVATYEAGGQAARFRIDLALKGRTGGIGVFTTGTLSREEESHSEYLLRDLAMTLEASEIAPSKERLKALPVGVALMGDNLSRGRGDDSYAGGFTSTPKGNWIVTKVFVAEGEGEFFLNLNPVDGIGEISIKDPEYGDVVITELSKVLR